MLLSEVPWEIDETWGHYANVPLPNGMSLQLWKNPKHYQCYLDEAPVAPDKTVKAALKTWLHLTPLEAQCLLHQLTTNPDEVIDGTQG